MRTPLGVTFYIGGSGKQADKSWYIPCHLVVRKMAELVHLLGSNHPL